MIRARADDTVLDDFVVIEWVDASFDMDEAPAPLTLQTAGWITGSHDEFVTVAGERDVEGTFYRAHTSILRENMRSIVRLQRIVE